MWQSRSDFLQRVQKNIIDLFVFSFPAVVRRNLETSYSLQHSGFIHSDTETMVMQEYLIPVKRFEIFVFNIREIFSRYDADVLKILISYLPQDHGGLLAGSTAHVFSFRIIYRQHKNEQSQQQVEAWTQELIRASMESNGSYILPFHVHSSPAQFFRAYPAADSLFEIKRRVDPANRFKNLFWEQLHDSVLSWPEGQLDPHAPPAIKQED